MTWARWLWRDAAPALAPFIGYLAVRVVDPADRRVFVEDLKRYGRTEAAAALRRTFEGG